MFHDPEWVLGLLIVLVYAHGRFNTPKTNRSSTTLIRFWFAAYSYYAGVFLLYLLIAGIVSSSPDAAAALGIGGGPLPVELDEITGPFLAALIMTTLLPNFPVISRIDDSLLKFFQDMGNIPIGVRILSGQLRKTAIAVPIPIQQDVRRYVQTKLAISELNADDLSFTNDDSPQALWTRALSLMMVVQSWEGKRRYSAVAHTFPEQYRAICEKVERLNVSAARCLPLFRQPENLPKMVAPKGGKALDPVAECQRTFREQSEDVLKELTEFIARGILKCELTHRERAHRLSEIGFLCDGALGNLDLNQVVMCTLMVFVILISSLLVLNSVGNGMTRQAEHALAIAAMVAAIYGAAVAAALIPKGSWGFARRTASTGRPIAVYCLSGILAILASAFISTAFKAVRYEDFSAAVFDLRWSYPWLSLSFTSAALTAYLADDYPARAPAPQWLRWIEGATLSSGLMLVSIFVHWMLQSLSMDPAFPAGREVPELDRLLPITGLVGLAIGLTVPHRYRLSVPPLRKNDGGAKDVDGIGTALLVQ